MDSNPTQAQRVLDYMEKHGSITQIEALSELGILRLASRISDLKKRGYKIDGKMVKGKNRYGEEFRVKQYSIGGE